MIARKVGEGKHQKRKRNLIGATQTDQYYYLNGPRIEDKDWSGGRTRSGRKFDLGATNSNAPKKKGRGEYKKKTRSRIEKVDREEGETGLG